jgi:hypothetical protein
MDVSVMLEKVTDNGYRATAFVPGVSVAEAPTREEALKKLEAAICDKLSNVEVVQLKIPDPPKPHAWERFAGIWRDHPDIEQIEKNIQEYRRQVDADPNRL